MRMKMGLHAGIKKMLAFNVTRTSKPDPETLDLRDEYASAFRTESYNDFWTHVLALNKGHLTTHRSPGSASADRLPSYRLFAEQLLDPDQSTVTRILGLTRTLPKVFSLLTEYFFLTSDASHLCGLLLKDIDRIRKRYKFSPESQLNPCRYGSGKDIASFPLVLARMTLFSRSNPFSTTTPSMSRFQAVQANCTDLLKRLESHRRQTQSRIRRFNKLRFGSAILLVGLTASLMVIVAAHAFVMLVAGPSLVARSMELVSVDQLSRGLAQLDSATKGTYILLRDLDTISRHVARLNNELEHVDGLVQMWLERGEDEVGVSDEVASQLRRNNQSFIEQVDELEEHLYLCFMTINRARNLVTKEILNSPNPLAI